MPQSFICPITCDMMEQPVVAADGHSYDRPAIEQWLVAHGTSPLTNAPLPHTEVVPNQALRHAMDEWREKQPMAIDPECLSLSERLLGMGSFGRVVEGTLTAHGRTQTVAVKMMPGLTQPEQRSQIEQELKAHLRAQQGADGVCRLLGTCDKDHQLCVVMKRYKRSLADAIAAAGRMPPAEIRRIGYALSCTLGQLHSAGVVVQDIKPQNVLLNEYDEPVFADFGISALIGRTTRIMPSSVKGTFNYMAPEAFEPPFGIEVDIWSLGCVLVEMATGTPPWADLQMQAIMMAVAVRQQAPEVPDAMPAVEVVRQCFAFTPSARPTAQCLAEALRPKVAALTLTLTLTATQMDTYLYQEVQ